MFLLHSVVVSLQIGKSKVDQDIFTVWLAVWLHEFDVVDLSIQRFAGETALAEKDCPDEYEGQESHLLPKHVEEQDKTNEDQV